LVIYYFMLKIFENFPTKTQRGLLPVSPEGNVLELAVSWPKEDSPVAIIIMCHPNPLEGGTMDNKVVTTVIKSFNYLGALGVSFNFRGVGLSSGYSYSNSLKNSQENFNTMGEFEDLSFVAHWVRAQYPNTKIFLGGFSFGSYVAYARAGLLDKEIKLAGLLTLAPAVNRWNYEVFELPKALDWLCIIGDQDEIVDYQQVYDFVKKIPVSSQLIKFHETGHFFHRKLIMLQDCLVKQYFKKI